jgi:ABC-type uncharacterized transport system auxiliary subunit
MIKQKAFMARRGRTFFSLMGLAILAGMTCGCVKLPELTQTGQETTCYTLEYEPASMTGEQLTCSLAVDSFTAAPLFSTRKIIYRQKPYQTGEYRYHQWHVTPAEAIAHLLARDLSQSGLFAAVLDPASTVPATFSVSGHLETFLEDNTRKPWQAVLGIEIQVIDEAQPDVDQSILMQKRYTAVEPCARENPRATAEAMSRAMAGLSRRIVQDVYDAIKTRRSACVNER